MVRFVGDIEDDGTPLRLAAGAKPTMGHDQIVDGDAHASRRRAAVAGLVQARRAHDFAGARGQGLTARIV
jgi:hypothetical protein